MDELSRLEYQALRRTVSVRGTARPLAFLSGIAVWAIALLTVLVALPNPVASSIPLMILLATFEAVRMLHTAVERIGRYIQVFYEPPPESRPAPAPAWEHVAMRLSGRVPGAGGHPLFLPIFLMATAVNLLAVVLPAPLPVELLAAGTVHIAFVVWMMYADRGMRRQRERELKRFRELRGTERDPATSANT